MQVNAEHSEDTRPPESVHYDRGFCAMTILAILWIMSLQAATQQVEKPIPWMRFFGWWMWAGFFFANVLALIVYCNYREKVKDNWLFIGAFVGQFLFYMITISMVYPQECTFTYYPGVYGVEFAGSNITLFDANATSNLPGRLLHPGSSDGDAADNEFGVECNMEICLAFGGVRFCTRGAREFFALLCHFSPLVFAYTFKHSSAQQLEVAIPLLNLVDIQDFFLLLLEDELILNFWGQDLSCEEDYVEASVKQLRKECASKSSSTWCSVLIVFLLSCGATAFYFITLKGHGGALAKRTMSKDPTGDHLVHHSKQVHRFTGCRWHAWRAFFNLVLIDVPFFCLRSWCSYAFHITASTLLVKNCVGVVHSVSVILLTCLKLNTTQIKDRHPLLHAFMKTFDDENFGAELQNGESDLTGASDEELEKELRLLSWEQREKVKLALKQLSEQQPMRALIAERLQGRE